MTWLWRPSPAGLFSLLAKQLEAWVPADSLEVDRNAIVRAVAAGIHARSPHLIHPCVSALSWPDAPEKTNRDVNFCVWVARHFPERALGKIVLTAPGWIWDGHGGFQLGPGRYDLTECTQFVFEQTAVTSLPAISLDPWCHSVGFALEESWACCADSSSVLSEHLLVWMRTLDWLASAHNDCFSWMSSVVKVVIPTAPPTKNVASGSPSRAPGVVLVSSNCDEVLAAELLVHEAAHRHLFAAEASGALVRGDHNVLYRSPLRKDRRPLRGILLALHALAYITAFYSEVLRRSGLRNRRLVAELRKCRRQYETAERTVQSAADGLTARGELFFTKTARIAEQALI